MDRRAAFFLGAAVVCAILIPVTEQAQRWVPAALAIVYVVLAVASLADKRTRTRGRADRPPDGSGRAGERPSALGFETDLEAIGGTSGSRSSTQPARPAASDLDQQ
jgi:hypothetical protein